MLLCLDVGNSQFYGGVFHDDQLLFRFRYKSQSGTSSDEIGVFLRNVLRENEVDPDAIKKIALCSVVPALDYSVRSACIKYFDIQPFILQAGVKTGLLIKYRNPLEVGADRIANAIAACHLFPDNNVFVVDFGTATTCCAITDRREYLGGTIMPGIRLSMSALEQNTAKLSAVEIIKPQTVIGRSTQECIQAGLYLAQAAAVKEIFKRFEQEYGFSKKPLQIGTGGFAHLFEKEGIFTHHEPDLVFYGLKKAYQLNR